MRRSSSTESAAPARRSAWAAVLGVILAASPGTGCSALFVEAPPRRPQDLPYFDCTSGRWAPNIDLAVAAVYGLATLAALGENRTNDSGGAPAYIVSTVAVVGGFGASAVYGYRQTAACREAKSELAERLNRAAMSRARAPYPDAWQAEAPPPYPALAAPGATAPAPAPAGGGWGPPPPPPPSTGAGRP